MNSDCDLPVFAAQRTGKASLLGVHGLKVKAPGSMQRGWSLPHSHQKHSVLSVSQHAERLGHKALSGAGLREKCAWWLLLIIEWATGTSLLSHGHQNIFAKSTEALQPTVHM